MIAMELEGKNQEPLVTSAYRELLGKGFLVGYHPVANLLRFYPALTIGQKDIAQLLENLDRILEFLR